MITLVSEAFAGLPMMFIVSAAFFAPCAFAQGFMIKNK